MKHLIALKGLMILGIIGLFAAFAVSSVFAGAPTGGSPLDPLMVPTDWRGLAPNTTLWFYFDYAPSTGAPSFGRRGPARGGRPLVSVAVDTNAVLGLQFAIFTPDQATNWLRDQTTAPVGRGAPLHDTSNGNVTHDLYWSGAFNSAGRYFVAIANPTRGAISFLLTVTGDTVTLYPFATPTATATIPAIFAVTPVPTGTLQGRILFETGTGGAIYTVNGDGTNLNLVTNGIDPAWSPDEKQIALARWGSTFPGLYVVNADGSNEHLVYQSSEVRSPKWSPDGKYIAFTQQKNTARQGLQWKLGVIELNKFIDVDNYKNALTEPQCTKSCYTPSWNSDSLSLTYTDPAYGIMATSIISGPETLVMGPTGTYFDTAGNVERPIAHLTQIQNSETSPDGTRIAYSEVAHDRWEINVVNADGSNRTGITSPNPVLYTFFGVTVHNVAPTWSPDGQQILFLSNRNSKWEFFAMNADGSNLHQVLKNVTDQFLLLFNYENERIADWAK